MEDFYMNINSQNNSYDYSNITSNYSNITSNYSNITYDYFDFYDWYYSSTWSIIEVVTYVIIGVGLLSTPIAIYALYSQVRNDHVAPIYVINLLISDLIQFCCMIIQVTPTAHWKIDQISGYIYPSALVASVGFMVCIALERYLVIVHPLWYRFRRSIKISVVVCVLVWVLALVTVLMFIFWSQSPFRHIIFSIIIFFPLPLFIFFLGGVLKALSASISVPSDEKRRIVAVLVLVLLIYTLLFLPSIIFIQATLTSHDYYYDYGYDYEYDFDFDYDALSDLSHAFLKLSPLADLILYVFMRKGTIDKFLSSVCCCRMDSDDTNSSVQVSSV